LATKDFLFFIAKPQKYLTVYLGVHFDEEVIDYLEFLSSKRVSIQLLIDQKSDDFLLAHPSILHRLLSIRSGDLMIVVNNKESIQYEVAVIKDFDNVLITADATNFFSQLSEEKGGQVCRDFNSFISESSVYRSTVQAIDLFVELSHDVVSIGSTIGLNWQSNNATEVLVQGKKTASCTGSFKLELFEDTVLVITGRIGLRSFRKTLFVRVLNGLAITYDLEYQNPISKEFVSLKKESNYPNVFGVSHGSFVKFSWEIETADKVNIQPWGYTRKVGAYLFQVNEKVEVVINAVLGDTKETLVVTVQQFPVPVFEGQFIKRIEGVNLNREVIYRDYRSEMMELTASSLRKLRTDSVKKSQASALNLYDKLSFRSFYKRNEVRGLNLLVLNRLINFYRSESKIKAVIESIKKYYENK
jgi:hypothetical protein